MEIGSFKIQLKAEAFGKCFAPFFNDVRWKKVVDDSRLSIFTAPNFDREVW